MALKHANRSGMVQLALGLFLLVLGIQGVSGTTGIQNDISRAFGKMLGGSYQFQHVLGIVFAVIMLLAGAFVLLEFFLNFGSITKIILFIVIILWIVYIIYANIYLGLFAHNFKVNVIAWLKEFSISLIVLAGLFQIQNI